MIKNQKTLKFTLASSQINPELANQLAEAEKTVAKLREQLTKELLAHPRYIAAADLAGEMTGSIYRGQKIKPKIEFSGTHLTISLPVDLGEETDNVNLYHYEPKVINNLLNSQILTKEEKRKLTSAIIPNLIKGA